MRDRLRAVRRVRFPSLTLRSSATSPSAASRRSATKAIRPSRRRRRRPCLRGGACSGRRGGHRLLRLHQRWTTRPGSGAATASTSTSRPRSTSIRSTSRIEPAIATLFNPLGAGFRWAVDMPRLQPGETIVILGPGQRGLGQRHRRARARTRRVIVTGLERDAAKLELAPRVRR